MPLVVLLSNSENIDPRPGKMGSVGEWTLLIAIKSGWKQYSTLYLEWKTLIFNSFCCFVFVFWHYFFFIYLMLNLISQCCLAGRECITVVYDFVRLPSYLE